ncbi:MAG: N-methyl-L-tryptophan oxidase [Chloroflexi bacterium]|nr:N-methyl-L-tryptophan oxidase [Chloroflexota bacterium]
MDAAFEVIVVGLGAMGSAATYHLAKRGARVLGIDMFRPGHDRGSSHGEHRMIRKSSFQLDGYVPLADRSFALWHALEAEAGQHLLHRTGEIWLVHEEGNPDYRAGIETSLTRGFRVVLGEAELAERFPGVRLGDGMIALYEADAGFLRCEAGIVSHVEQARQRGATIHLDEEVVAWSTDGAGVRVETRQGSYGADHLILTAGPWSEEHLRDLRLPMQVERRVNGFFRPSRPELWSVERGALDFLLDVPEGSFYGMPAVGDIGVKIGLSAGERTTARTIRRTIDDAEIALLRDVLDRYLPGASGPESRRMTCMCTYTVDGNFIIDRHPAHDQVSIACGFSGRGYKFAPVVGEILADLALLGATAHEIGFLSARRFAQSAVA